MQYTATSLKTRLRVFFIVIICVAVTITGRLCYVQLFRASALRFLAAEQWYRDLPLMAKRGNIYDRNGILMAQSTLTYSVYVRPVAVTNPENVAQVLSSHLKTDYNLMLSKAKNRGASDHLIKMQVDKSTAMEIVAHNENGIYISQTYNRDYPMGSTAGQVLGLVSVDSHGQGGVEAYYDTFLRGIDGRTAVQSDLRGRPIKNGETYYTPSIDGNNMVLNLDAQIQRAVQDICKRAYDDQGAKNVSALVMDMETGGVLASCAAPYFDMNMQPRENVTELLEQVKNLPMVNVLEPGSTFKIITLAAAIEEGITNESELFSCSGARMIGSERVKCWKSTGHGTQDLAHGVMTSCNCVFMDLAIRLGVDKYYEYLNKFGIGKKSGIDSFAEPSGLILKKETVRPVDLARIGFGQAIAISPIQFQSIMGAVVGDGILKTPRIVNHIENAPNVIQNPVKGRILSQKTVDRVRDMLYGVVSEGSGKHAGIEGFHVGGKTGTAQKYKDKIIDQGKYISSFIGFLTVDGRAKYSAYLMVDEPMKNGYYGSVVAAPYVGQIFNEIVDILSLKRDPNIHAALIPEWSTLPFALAKLVPMPDIAGMQIQKAITTLEMLGFFVEVDGDGALCTGSFPKAGSLLQKGEPIVVLTDGVSGL
jgi:stage V sporulation protein D (sporulation-specific penicillin-binding protein)